ncbi:hypothetical protein [Actinoplanes palleronii]|uniref:Uncharacterized protein n=1 Tax=Actinoplanes palleronii TaxID=113570 RepID=A0ABQ4BKD4_9ACTN|nr:hypothetical protein [Actinoplanes palleronii]GIE71123.1 hypothetical protein Apa02nite_072310 [Actinoplanes palleronii]
MFRWLQRIADGAQESTGMPTDPVAPLLGAPPPSPPEANFIVKVESRDACFPFDVHLVVRYGLLDGAAVGDPLVVAKAGVDRRVRAVARQHTLTETTRLRGELEIELSRQAQVESTGVVAWASCVAVYAHKQLIEEVWRYEALRRQETTRIWNRETEEAEITYLSRMIDDPSRATAWWLRQNPDAIQKLPEIARTFKALRADLDEEGIGRANGTRDNWDEIFADFCRRADPSARYLLEHQLNQVFVENKLDDLADRARLLNGDPPRP